MSFAPSARRAALAASGGIVVLALSGCGGGGSSGGGSGSVANAAPQFTSATIVSVVENGTAPALTLAASDANGDAVSFAISGGPDAAAFVVSDTSLGFREPADFERPADTNRDNVHNVTVVARDARGASTSADLVITVTNSKEGIAVTRVATEFVNPVALGFLQTLGPAGFIADGRFAVAQTSGEIFDVDGTTGART